MEYLTSRNVAIPTNPSTHLIASPHYDSNQELSISTSGEAAALTDSPDLSLEYLFRSHSVSYISR